MRSSARIRMGTEVLRFSSESPDLIALLRKNYSSFLCSDKPGLDVVLKRNQKKMFSKGTKMVYSEPEKTLSITGKYSYGKYWLQKNKMVFWVGKENEVFSEFIHSLCVLFGFYMAGKRKGLLLHASGLINKKEAILFSGPSGSGKTFLARYYKSKPSFRFMNDERILLQIINGQVYAFSTIFSGKEELRPQNYGSKLKRLYFLKYSRENKALNRNRMFCLIKPLENSLLSSYLVMNSSLSKMTDFKKNYFVLLSDLSSKANFSELRRKKQV